MSVRIVSVGERGRFRKYLYIQISDGRIIKLLPEIAIGESLIVGRELSEEEIGALRKKQSSGEIYLRALNILSRRAHSRGELYDKLLMKGEAKEEIQRVIERLDEAGYMDDEAFAQAFASSRLQRKPCGRKLLALELRQRKVAPNIIEKVLDEAFAGFDEAGAATAILKKYSARFEKYEGYELKRRLYRFLRNRGFSPEGISGAIENFKI